MTQDSGKQDGWKVVNKTDPCEICGHDDWCRRSRDGCHECHRIVIDVPGFKLLSTTRAGFGLYRPDDPTAAPYQHQRRAKPASKREMPEDTKDWAWIVLQCVNRLTGKVIASIAATLGVTVASLQLLNVGITTNGVWTFPMRNETRKVVGIRTRTPDGQKRSFKGSKEGVFVPMGRTNLTNPLVICEGPTDTAAFMDLGFNVIGRPSNLGGAAIIAELAREYHVVICYDNDKAGSRAEVNTQRGKELLVRALHKKARSVRAIHPVIVKDVRDWVRGGATREAVLQTIEDAREC